MKIIYIPRKYRQGRKRVAAYCRVSTEMGSQDESFETQVKNYTEQIQKNPEWEFAGIYSDEKSGTKAQNRRGFQEMIRDAVNGEIDLILVKSISRFSRNIVDCQNYVNLLQGNGVDLYFEREGISTADPSSGLLFSLLSVIAQDESRSISENVKWGYRERFKRGEYNLGNHRILGYDTKNGKLVPNQDAWIVRMVYRLFLEHKTYRQIAAFVQEAGGQRMRSTKSMNSSAILYILRNETYVGDKFLQKQAPKNFLTKRPEKNVAYESFYLQNDHEAIIDRKIWDETQKLLERRRKARESGICHNASGQHFLYGKVFCAYCGSPYVRRTLCKYEKNFGTAEEKERQHYKAWSCRERIKGKKGNGCKNMTIKETELLEILYGENQKRRGGLERRLNRKIEKILIDGKDVRIVQREDDAKDEIL